MHQVVILLRLCITFNYNNRENVAPLCTQPLIMITFGLLNSPFYIDITCKEVLLGKVMIEMKSFQEGLIFQGMFPSLQQPLPIILLDFCSPHGLLIWRVKRCLVLPSMVPTFHQVQMTSHKGLTASISLVLVWLFLFVNTSVLMT